MAHFAQLDENNTVTQVLVVPDEQEHRGQEFLAQDLELGGNWIQTSYNASIRGKFAGIGDIYDSEKDEFIPRPKTEEELQADAIVEQARLDAEAKAATKAAALARLGLTEEEIEAFTK